MSWKHAKFDDSAVFRSLEKIAQQKEIVKNSEIVKTAEKSFDLKPSGNLTDNVMKLCAGLRAQGLENRAAELESKFINYKRAETLYETSKEEGEDLVDAAHPKGSHKLESVDGDATIETIIDQHLKLVDIVNKKPTGKLATNKDILNAVKMALGQDASEWDVETLYTEGAKTMVTALNNAKKAVEDFQKIPRIDNKVMVDLSAKLDPYIKYFSEYTPDSGQVDVSETGPWLEAKKLIDALINKMNQDDQTMMAANPASRTNPDDKKWWASFDQVRTKLKMALNLTFKALHQFQGKKDTSAQVTKKPVYEVLFSLGSYLNNVKATFNKLNKSKLSNLSPDEQKYIKTFETELNNVAAKVAVVAESFNPTGSSSYDPASEKAIYDIKFLPSEFKGSSLQGDFAGVDSLDSLKSKSVAIKKDYLDTYNQYIKPLFDKANAS